MTKNQGIWVVQFSVDDSRGTSGWSYARSNEEYRGVGDLMTDMDLRLAICEGTRSLDWPYKTLEAARIREGPDSSYDQNTLLRVAALVAAIEHNKSAALHVDTMPDSGRCQFLVGPRDFYTNREYLVSMGENIPNPTSEERVAAAALRLLRGKVGRA